MGHREQFPCLLYSHGKGCKDKTFRPISSAKAKHHQTNHVVGCCVSPLQGKKVVACVQGWLFLLPEQPLIPEDAFFSLWNPLTSHPTIPPLPVLNVWGSSNMIFRSELKFDSYVLYPGGDQRIPTVLLFSNRAPIIYMCELIDGCWKWTRIHYDKAMEDFGKNTVRDHLHHSICCNGDLYALIPSELPRNELTVVRIDDLYNTLVFHPLGSKIPLPKVVNPYVLSSSLIGSCGDLFVVTIVHFRGGETRGNQVTEVNVYKLNFLNMVWEHVYDLKDRALFVTCSDNNNSAGSFTVSKSSSFEGNRVYIILEGDTNIYLYNLEDGTVAVSSPFPNIPNPCLSPIWVIIPNKEGKMVNGEEHVLVDKAQLAKESTNLSDLSLDQLKQIGESMFLFDYMNFRAVCKSFHSVAPPDPIQRWTSDPRCLTPWLVYSPKGKNQCNLVNANQPNRYCTETPQLLQDYVVRCSTGSWVLMSTSQMNSSYPIALFNPFTKAIIQLPDFPYSNPVVGFAFTLTSSDNLVMGIVMEGRNVRIVITSPGEEEWRYSEFRNDSNFSPSNINPVIVNGNLVCLNLDGKLAVLKNAADDKGRDWCVYDKPQAPFNYFHQSFLLAIDGNLFSVFVGHLGTWVGVFRLGKDGWIRVHDLGNKIIYVSNFSSFSSLAKVPGTGNRIYFPRFFQDRLVFFSLRTRKFHACGDDEDSPIDYKDTREQVLCGWTKPCS